MRYIVEQSDEKDYPLYGPFDTQEQADAFTLLVEGECKVRELNDPMPVRNDFKAYIDDYDRLMGLATELQG